MRTMTPRELDRVSRERARRNPAISATFTTAEAFALADAREEDVRREYGSVGKAVWDAECAWADGLSTAELKRLKKLRIPGNAGIAVEGALGRRRYA